ncbi:MAG TPA: hypothetical protein VG890_01435 [Puia sp.]|nr:hypothetical protein [Puia sp.]
MERLQHLIGKLNEQSEQKESPLQMLVTLKQIEAELTRLHTVTATGRKNPAVSVVMPSLVVANHVIEAEMEPVRLNGVPEIKKTYEPQQETLDRQSWDVDPLVEVPTLSHQAAGQELNDVIAPVSPSINDRLKENVAADRGSQLKGGPVKELRKAIGVNDRFVFINELFRGDEPMYERSIKTINNFRILPEAEYWMERELKIKLGWDDSREIVQHFYQIVSRRFS